MWMTIAETFVSLQLPFIRTRPYSTSIYRTYLVMPVVNDTSGKISFPSASFALEISKPASMVAIAIQIFASARYCPGQTLHVVVVSTCAFSSTYIHFRDVPATKSKMTNRVRLAVATLGDREVAIRIKDHGVLVDCWVVCHCPRIRYH